ncbi:5,10-methylenetetrahydromethanopterin reductase [Glaciihabitans sp. UYNi722]
MRGFTMSRMRLGIAFVPTSPPEALKDLAMAAESAGLDDLWVWEDCFKESGVASATAALAWTARLRVGLGLMPAPLRNVAMTAMEIATVDRLFPGRFVAGVGHGVQEWMAQTGSKATSPMTLLTEYLDALRALLGGQTVTTHGEYVHLDDVRLTWSPDSSIPLFVGGAGPRTLRLSGELGDGSMLTAALTDGEIEEACGHIRTGVSRRNGSPAAHEIVATGIVATGSDARARVDAEAALWRSDLSEPIGYTGDAQQIAASINRLAATGITTFVVQPTADEPDITGFAEWLGRSVLPLLD